MRYVFATAMIVLSTLILAGSVCAEPVSRENQKFPAVLSVGVKASGENRFDFDVTISSPYDTQQRYADGFRVIGDDGVVYGERKLWHDHADEQPFTRDLHGVSIKAGVHSVQVQGRDQKFAYGGKTATVILPGR